MAHCSSCIHGLCSVLLWSWYVNQMFLCRSHLTVLMVWVPVFCCVQKLYYSAMHRSPNLLYSVAAVFCSYWESGISQTALQEAWLNLPPHSHTQFLHQWWWWPWWQWWWQRCKLRWRWLTIDVQRRQLAAGSSVAMEWDRTIPSTSIALESKGQYHLVHNNHTLQCTKHKPILHCSVSKMHCTAPGSLTIFNANNCVLRYCEMPEHHDVIHSANYQTFVEDTILLVFRASVLSC